MRNISTPEISPEELKKAEDRFIAAYKDFYAHYRIPVLDQREASFQPTMLTFENLAKRFDRLQTTYGSQSSSKRARYFGEDTIAQRQKVKSPHNRDLAEQTVFQTINPRSNIFIPHSCYRFNGNVWTPKDSNFPLSLSVERFTYAAGEPSVDVFGWQYGRHVDRRIGNPGFDPELEKTLVQLLEIEEKEVMMPDLTH